METRRIIALSFAAVLAFSAAMAADRKKKSAEEEKLEDLNELAGRYNKLTRDAELSEEQRFIHARVAELLERAREAPAKSYVFERLESAIDDLLDGSGEIRKVREPDEDEAKEDRERNAQSRTARELERAYFRVKQGDYFGKLSGDSRAQEHVRVAGRLYQHGRQAYDSQRFWRARRYADAARELIDSLESLAQAAVPVPEPPEL
jgi:hypothetical protein